MVALVYNKRERGSLLYLIFMVSPTTKTLEIFKSSASQLSWKIPYLNILVLFGSQATGKTNDDSDWDFAALYDENLYTEQRSENAWDLLAIPDILGEVFQIEPELIDVVDLNRCHAFVADSIGTEGQLIYEKVEGEFDHYRKTIILSHEQKKQITQQLRRNIDYFLETWSST